MQSDKGTSMLRGIIFDVDGTLYHQGILRIIISIRLAMAVLIHPIKTLGHIRILIHYRKAQEWLRRNSNAKLLTTDEQLRRAAMTTGLPLEDITLCIHQWIECIPLRFLSLCARRGLLRLIHDWYSLGVPMGVYSDYPARDKLNKLGLLSVLPIVVCSTDEDVMAFKPSPRGFKVTAAKMGLSPQNVVYIGDREDVDIIGAENAGMRSINIRRIKKERRTPRSMLTLETLDHKFREFYAER